jgi:hypothetical protein
LDTDLFYYTDAAFEKKARKLRRCAGPPALQGRYLLTQGAALGLEDDALTLFLRKKATKTRR